MEQCPQCIGSKQVFNGEDYETCTFCNGKGQVSADKAQKFDPLDDLNFTDEFEDT